MLLDEYDMHISVHRTQEKNVKVWPLAQTRPELTCTSTLCLKKNDNDVAHYNFNVH